MIREYLAKDKESVKNICIETAGGVYKDKPQVTLLLFCDYYIESDNGLCYVLCDEFDHAVGYVFSIIDYKKYIKEYKQVYLPKLKEVDKKEYRLKKLSLVLDRILGVNYPSHLHIDILEDYCGGGNGTRLISAMLLRLQVEKVKGVWLGVDVKNARAISFYQKIGFNKLKIFNKFGLFAKALV